MEDVRQQTYWRLIEKWWETHDSEDYPYKTGQGRAYVAMLEREFHKHSFEVENDFIHPRFWGLRKFGQSTMFQASWYFITLTSTIVDPTGLLSAYTKIVNSKMYGIDKFIVAWELTERKLPHVHLLVHVTKGTPKKREIQAFNGGNFVDIKRVKGDECVRVIQYMKKQQKDEELIKFCKENFLTSYIDASKIQETKLPKEEIFWMGEDD